MTINMDRINHRPESPTPVPSETKQLVATIMPTQIAMALPSPIFLYSKTSPPINETAPGWPGRFNTLNCNALKYYTTAQYTNSIQKEHYLC